MLFRKCPYCRGKNLYLKRTSPVEVLGCRDCDKTVRFLKEKGLSMKEIKKVITKKK